MLTQLQDVLAGLLGKIGLPKPLQDVVVHAAIVFVLAFAGVVVKTGLAGAGWSVLIAAGAAGLSALAHYAAGFVPKPTPAPAVAPVPAPVDPAKPAV